MPPYAFEPSVFKYIDEPWTQYVHTSYLHGIEHGLWFFVECHNEHYLVDDSIWSIVLVVCNTTSLIVLQTTKTTVLNFFLYSEYR